MFLQSMALHLRSDRSVVGPCVAAVAGFVVFCLVLNVGMLEPRNLGWLASGDSAQSYIGWMFYRHAPWIFPLGAVQGMGMEQSSSIVYTDSIPLLALLFKLVRFALPHDFQYAGLWLCSCFALQGYFAYRLLSLFTRDRLAVAAGTLLFLISPVMLLRMSAHFALSAQWIVVCALYLYYLPPRRRHLRQWLVLLWSAPLVHAYLAFMAYAVWAAYLLRHGALDRQRAPARMFVWAMASVLGSITVMWLIGYFGDMDVSTFGFGYYSMNLLAPWMPVGAGPFLIPSPDGATAGQYEGFNYLGLGVVGALLMALASRIVAWKKHPPLSMRLAVEGADAALVLCCMCLTLLSISNVATFGTHVLYQRTLPHGLDRLANIFRCSGRMFWPVYYALLMAAVRGVTRWPMRVSSVLLAIVLVLQLTDMWPYLRFTHNVAVLKVSFQKFPTFDSPFWKLARQRYDNLYVIPGQYDGDEYIGYEYLAATYAFNIDTAFYARMPVQARQRERLIRHEAFFGGSLDPHGLYLVQASSDVMLRFAQTMFSPTTGVGRIDGFTVVAPHWFEQGETDALHTPVRSDFPPVSFDRDYAFSSAGDGVPFLLGGWSTPGNGGVWSLGSTAWLVMHRSASPSNLRISLQLQPYLPPAYPHLEMHVFMAGHELAHWVFQRDKLIGDLSFEVPAIWQDAAGNLALKLSFDAPRSPQDANESADPRPIAVRLSGLQIQRQ